jgi:cellulose biosynthesis protein BcsQ
VTGAGAPPARRVLVAGAGAAGAAGLKSAVALNLAAALAAAGAAVRLRDLDGASSRGLAAAAGPLGAGGRVRLPWAAADLAVVRGEGPGDPGADDGDAGLIEVVDPPPRFDASVRALAASAALVVVPVDASALARRVLGEVAPAVAAGGGRLRVVLTRRLPRAADRWALVDQLDALAPDALSPVTLPVPRPGAAGAAALYAPGTRGARAYAQLAADVRAQLAACAAAPASLSTSA